jgi:hypothetical protein
MLSEHYSPVRALIIECEQLAERRFATQVHIRVGLVPSLDGDFWSAEVLALAESVPLEAPCHARGKIAVLRALREHLIASSDVDDALH